MKKLFAMMLMLASVFFFACDDDEENVMAPEDAKAAMEEVGGKMATTMEEMQDVEGIKVMGVLMNLPDPFTATSKSNARTSVIPNINRFLLPTQPERTKSAYEVTEFDFDTYKGVYTYHNTPYPYWNFVPGGSVIEINFPSDTADMETNDAKLTIYNYDEISITYYDDYYGEYYDEYYPTNIHADLKLNSVEIVDISLTASWVTTGDAAGEPTSLDISVYLIPFEFTGEFNHSGNSASVDFTIKYESNIVFAAGLGAAFTTTDMEETPLNINGKLQLFNVKFVASVDLKDIETIMYNMQQYQSEEAIVSALNAEISAYVLVDGIKAADIKLAMSSLAMPYDLPFDIVFVYGDGTSESALPYFAEFGEDLDSFFTFLDDFYGDWK